MANCECLGTCPFFNDQMENMPGLSNMYKRSYCKGEFANCARYMVFKSLGKAAVPGDLFPNQQDRAREVIGAGRA